MIELRIVLCLVARRFEVCAAYEELDAEEDRTKRMKMARGRTVDGERAYQVGKGEPSASLPCRVRELALDA